MKKVRAIFSAAIVLALCACTVVAQGNSVSGNTVKGQHQPRQYKFTNYRLANGLRVVLAPDETQPGVAVNISYGAGSRVESPEQAGLATLLQRILLQNLRRSQDRGRGEGDGGASKPFEGVTNQERASYFTELDAGELDFVLSLLARQLGAPDITQSSVGEQRLVILNECGQLDERRFGRVQEVLLQLIYKDFAHKYGAICSLPSLNHLSLERTKAFLKTYYVLNNAVIAIVGNFKKNDAEKLVAKHFAAVRRRTLPANTDLSDRPLSLERRKVLGSPRADAATYMSAYPTVPSNHPDWYAMNILADIIGQGDSSRLYTALVATKLAASIPEGVAESRGRSLFRIGAALLPNVSVEMVEAIIDAELARIRKSGVTRAEIERARLQERAYYTEQLRSPSSRASFLARSTLYYDAPSRINTELGFILAVTAQDVRRVAKKYVVKTNRAVVIAKPAVQK